MKKVWCLQRSYGPGEAIFGKYDTDKLVEDGCTDYSTDEDEDEEDIPRKKKKHKIRPWDVLVNIVAENVQDTFNETVDKTLAEHQNEDIQEAEEMAYEELKPSYLSELQVSGWDDSCIKERSSPPGNNKNS